MINNQNPTSNSIGNSINRHVASQLKKRREALGLSLDEISIRLNITVDEARELEIGARTIDANTLFALCGALDVPISYLFSGGEVPGPKIQSPTVKADVEFLRQFLTLSGENRQMIRDLVRSLQDGGIGEINVD